MFCDMCQRHQGWWQHTGARRTRGTMAVGRGMQGLQIKCFDVGHDDHVCKCWRANQA
jgi:hypothetical protein